jgi:hypothetical protein
LGPKPEAEKNRAQKVFLFLIFFQLTQKISARSEKLSALVVKGLNLEKPFFTIFTMSLTPGGSPPPVLFHLGLCGAVFPATSPAEPAGVWPASGARFTTTHAWTPNPSPSHNSVFLTSMYIDLVGPLQYSNNFNYIFTVIDRTSK